MKSANYITNNVSKNSDNLAFNKNFSPDISNQLIDWNSKQKIQLLNHQLLTIDYLEKNPNIKGLLVYHNMGTGKTFLAIGFAERDQGRDVVLFVPRFLKTHWKKNLEIYGVKNLARYRIFTHTEPGKLLNLNLTNSIVIIDESHKFIDKINGISSSLEIDCAKAYINFRNAHRILLLSGTPIYNETIDIAYQINLLSDNEIMPFNKADFRNKFTKVKQHKSFFRGHLLESSIVDAITSTSLLLIGVATHSFPLAVVSPCLPFIKFFLKSSYPIDSNYFREYDSNKLAQISSQYISYYNFNQVELKDYPDKNIQYKDVPYNAFQLDFLINFADSRLDIQQLSSIQKDEDIDSNYAYLQLNSSTIQDGYKLKQGSGRQIGNLAYYVEKKIVYPKKFITAYAKMLQSDGPIVIYSHYYHNGILKFKQYLDSVGQTNYALLDPELSENDYEEIITKYNEGRLKFLLIHPEITEGISLKGTRQLHILEPCINKSLQDQIIGRAVRYKSHAHLPKNKRFVDVYIWRQVIPLTFHYATSLRSNWQQNYPEVNFYTERKIMDGNALLKSQSPDVIAYENMNKLDHTSEEMQHLLQNCSIENKYNLRYK